MEVLFDLPLAARLALVFFMAALAASWANAAIYAWAWTPRQLSPWQRMPEDAPPRSWADRLPIIGWLRLQRESSLHGFGFWLRPLLIEFGFAVGLMLLYWWEVDQRGLLPSNWRRADNLDWPLHLCFFGHAVLATLMLIGSWIDIDEKIIPDLVTFPGVLLGLILMTFAPQAMLPCVVARDTAPLVATELTAAPQGDFSAYVIPVHVVASNPWPQLFSGRPVRWSLLIGLGCYWLWIWSLTDRRWPTRDRFATNLSIWCKRVGRDLRSRPLREALILGTLFIAMVWYSGGGNGGGGAWQGLLTALIGMAGGGGIVWAVRIVGSAALRREAMGFGDVTLMMMIGAFLGWQACLVLFFIAPFAGLLVGLLQLITRRDDVIPYGPFLCVAAVTVIIYWADIWQWGEPIFSIGWLAPAVLAICFVMLGVLLGLWQTLKTRLLGASQS